MSIVVHSHGRSRKLKALTTCDVEKIATKFPFWSWAQFVARFSCVVTWNYSQSLERCQIAFSSTLLGATTERFSFTKLERFVMSKKILITSFASDNPKKVYVVKKYPCGTYYENQFICGKQFYKKWIRTTKKFINEFLAVDSKGQPVFSMHGEA